MQTDLAWKPLLLKIDGGAKKNEIKPKGVPVHTSNK